MAAGLVVAGCPVSAGALVPAAGTFAPLAPAPRPVLGAWCELAGAVGAGAAAGGELGVEDVECVGGDLGDVDVVEGSQVAGDDLAALLERVRRPPALLDRDPLGGEVAEGAARVGPRLARRRSTSQAVAWCWASRLPVASTVFVAQRLAPVSGSRPVWTRSCHRQEGSCRTLAIATPTYGVPSMDGTPEI